MAKTQSVIRLNDEGVIGHLDYYHNVLKEALDNRRIEESKRILEDLN